MSTVQISLDQMIQSLLDSKKYTTLRDMLTTMNPADIAGVFRAAQRIGG